eukprot:TRINITY_DN74686_c0_g1_i1.p1 TRINITY_DN74686_c0_g1~~TRINITY_DN74686_c0_g1_i1.p1  ORF type:complete len:338 (+),score=25.38 TRINITY_DN74686_c0_g1_i1:37-1050(+)
MMAKPFRWRRRSQRLLCNVCLLIPLLFFHVKFLPQVPTNTQSREADVFTYRRAPMLHQFRWPHQRSEVRHHLVQGPCAVPIPPRASRAPRRQHVGSVTRQALPVDLADRILNAASAGAVAACVQAALFALTELIVNRVTVERMPLRKAIAAVTPSMILRHFRTTLPTSLIKAPFYEAVVTLTMALPIAVSLQGMLMGFVFTTVTMPITNFRARMSLQEDFGWGDMYVAYLPTLIRDIVGGVSRARFTKLGIEKLGLLPATPKLMFFVVLCSCICAAPFNELRGYMLQKRRAKSFFEFFQPLNCIRSTSVGAINFAFSASVGYWLAPIFTQLLRFSRP